MHETTANHASTQAAAGMEALNRYRFVTEEGLKIDELREGFFCAKFNGRSVMSLITLFTSSLMFFAGAGLLIFFGVNLQELGIHSHIIGALIVCGFALWGMIWGGFSFIYTIGYRRYRMILTCQSGVSSLQIFRQGQLVVDYQETAPPALKAWVRGIVGRGASYHLGLCLGRVDGSPLLTVFVSANREAWEHRAEQIDHFLELASEPLARNLESRS